MQKLDFSWIALRYKSRLRERGQVVGGALLLWETRLVRSVWENLAATHCLAFQGIAEESRAEHGGRVEQGRVGRAWETAWESRAKK